MAKKKRGRGRRPFKELGIQVRTERIDVVVTPNEKRKFMDAASRSGLSFANYKRVALLGYAGDRPDRL